MSSYGSGSFRQRILVPLDGQEWAEQALLFASAFGDGQTDLVLARVVENPAEAVAAQSELDELANLRTAGFSSVQAVVRIGGPADEILAVAAETDANLIVMATRARTGIGRLTHGSVADEVARRASVPCMVIPEKVLAAAGAAGLGKAPIDEIIVPLDSSDGSRVVLPVAIELAKELGVGIRLMQAVSPSAVAMSAGGPGMPMPEVVYDDIFEALEEGAKEHLMAVQGEVKAAGVECRIEVLTGPSSQAIVDALTQHDLIVMPTHARSGLARVIMGSVAERLIRSGKAPVVLVKFENHA